MSNQDPNPNTLTTVSKIGFSPTSLEGSITGSRLGTDEVFYQSYMGHFLKSFDMATDNFSYVNIDIPLPMQYPALADITTEQSKRLIKGFEIKGIASLDDATPGVASIYIIPPQMFKITGLIEWNSENLNNDNTLPFIQSSTSFPAGVIQSDGDNNIFIWTYILNSSPSLHSVLIVNGGSAANYQDWKLRVRLAIQGSSTQFQDRTGNIKGQYLLV